MANKTVLVAVAASLAFALTPALMNANTATAPGIVGSNCLIKIYHTNFNFPAEGGRIVNINGEMFFWRDYLPNCSNALVGSGAQVVTSNPPTSQTISSTLNGSLGTQLADSPCAVRVYHTNFAFPTEGGQVVRVGQELFFVRTYRPECAGAGQAGTVVMSAGQAQVNNTQTVTPQTNTDQPTPPSNSSVCF